MVVCRHNRGRERRDKENDGPRYTKKNSLNGEEMFNDIKEASSFWKSLWEMEMEIELETRTQSSWTN